MLISDYSVINTEVAVIGSGGAALKAALTAHEHGAEVLILTKGDFGASGATWYSAAETAGFCCPNGHYDPTDSPDVYYQDIINAAEGCIVPELARLLADRVVAEKDYLENIGLEFARTADGKYLSNLGCFSSKRRNLLIPDHFKPLLATLRKRLMAYGVRVMGEVTATCLIVANEECGGVFAIDHGGSGYMIRAKSVILATGGASRLFSRNLYPSDITGDGYAMAHRAGVRLANMEFIQSGIASAYPKLNLFRHHFWEAEPHITNAHDEVFLDKYIHSKATVSLADVFSAKKKHFPFSSRDDSKYLELGIFTETCTGFPNERGNVYADFRDVDFNKLFENPDSKLGHIWPLVYDQYQKMGIDLYRDKIEIACFAHSMSGGVLIDRHSESSVKGLYAAGEVSTGQHGADRLGGNMGVMCQVFGRIAGEAAAARAKSMKKLVPFEESKEANNEFLSKISSQKPGTVTEFLVKLQKSADASILIERNEAGILSFIETLREVESFVHEPYEVVSSASIVQTVELLNLVQTGKMVANSALMRKESRGSHFRSDYPAKDPSFGKMIVI